MELDRLIDTEQRNDTLVRRAREEAEAMVQQAQAAAAEREAALATVVQQLIRDTEASLAAELARRSAVIATNGAAAAARFDAVTDAQIANFVPRLLDALVADSGPT